MRGVLDVEPPPERALFDRREVATEHRIHQPKPSPSDQTPERGAREDLTDRVVPQINPRVHRQHRQAPRQGARERLVLGVGEADPPVREQGVVRGEEEHVGGVAGGPAVGIAHLEQRARLGPGLLDPGLDVLADELRDEEAEEEEHPLQLAAEDEVRHEAAEADEDGDERDPREEVAEPVAPVVAHVGHRHGLQRRRRRRHGGGVGRARAPGGDRKRQGTASGSCGRIEARGAGSPGTRRRGALRMEGGWGGGRRIYGRFLEKIKTLTGKVARSESDGGVGRKVQRRKAAGPRR